LGRIGSPWSRGAKSVLAHLLPVAKETRPLWVSGGASGRSYSDNASVVHKHVSETRPDVDARWVIDADSPDASRVQGPGHTVERGSLAAHRLARSADVILFSHGVHDVPGLLWNNDAIRVRVGHGVTAFGRTRGRMPRSTARMTRAVDLAPVASEMEQDHKVQWGFPREKLPITGLPRWDEMVACRRDRSSPERSQVLYAPTSRPWHSASDARPDGALQPIFEFLSSPTLRRALEAGEFDLSVYFHQITRPFPFEAHNRTAQIASFEGVLILLLILASLARLRGLVSTVSRRPYVMLAAVYCTGFIIAFSNFSNFGILTRQRAQLLPFIAVLLALPLANRRSELLRSGPAPSVQNRGTRRGPLVLLPEESTASGTAPEPADDAKLRTLPGGASER
jgi:hypothetical protein